MNLTFFHILELCLIFSCINIKSYIVPTEEEQGDMNLRHFVWTRNLVNQNSDFVRALSFDAVCHKAIYNFNTLNLKI